MWCFRFFYSKLLVRWAPLRQGSGMGADGHKAATGDGVHIQCEVSTGMDTSVRACGDGEDAHDDGDRRRGQPGIIGKGATICQTSASRTVMCPRS
ncbi:hypothetical protein VTO73DRAFT_6523 [Trametes versicolor]